MNYRLTELLSSEAANTAGTKTIDIDVKDPISRIVITFKGTNNGATPTAHPAKMISKIELVDGSDVLFSLSGIECQALNYYETGVFPLTIMDFRNDVMAIPTFQLNFGRYLWDEVLALDPSKFRNLQLKITHNKASGGSAPDAGNLRVQAFLFDEKVISPMGFLTNKEIKSYSLTSSAHEYTDLPTDYSYRRLIIQSLAAEKQPHEQFNKVKLYEDEGKRLIVPDMSTSDLCKLMTLYPKVVESILGTGTGSAVEHFCTPTYETYIVVGAITTALASIVAQQSYGGSVDVNVDNAEHFQSQVTGYCPHGAVDIVLSNLNDVDSYFNPANLGSLKLDLTAGSSVGSSSTCEIVTQQLRKY